jgi:enterochelin esterase-like enzyme
VVQEYNPIVTEKQAFRIVFTLAASLALCLGVVSCQQQLAIALPPVQPTLGNLINPVSLITPTPFQAQSPTPRPTSTPTPTLVPTATTPPCLSQKGQMEVHEEYFNNHSKPLGFRVYLPPCYGADPDARYPVLYMIHGQTFADDQWDHLGIDEAADEMIQAKKAPPFLIVMPREDDTYADIYLTRFAPDFITGLIPWIDAHYQTCAERTCRAIGGLSRGGAWALRLGFTHWELFGSIGLHSTPPFTGDPQQFPGWLKKIPPDQIPRVFMDTGKRDYFLNMTSEFEGLLVRYGVPHEWYLFNGTHEEAYWSAHVADYLAWYTQPWKEAGQ